MQHPRATAAATALALTFMLAACGGSDEPADGSENGSGQASEAGPEEYRTLVETIDENAPDGANETLEEYEAGADFPDSYRVAEFDNDAGLLCIEDTDTEIALRLMLGEDSARIDLLDDGLCADGEAVSSLVGDPEAEDVDPGFEIEGDQEIGEAVAEVFENTD